MVGYIVANCKADGRKGMVFRLKSYNARDVAIAQDDSEVEHPPYIILSQGEFLLWHFLIRACLMNSCSSNTRRVTHKPHSISYYENQ